MIFKVNLIWDGKVLEPAEYPNFYIRSKTIDRIVNEIYEKSVNGQKEAKEKNRLRSIPENGQRKTEAASRNTREKEFPL